MRTTVLVSAMLLAEAICPGLTLSESSMNVVGATLVFGMLMDIAEFFKRMCDKEKK